MNKNLRELIFCFVYFVVFKIFGFEITAIILLSQIFYQLLTNQKN
jgi:hypothetical protein